LASQDGGSSETLQWISLASLRWGLSRLNPALSHYLILACYMWWGIILEGNPSWERLGLPRNGRYI